MENKLYCPFNLQKTNEQKTCSKVNQFCTIGCVQETHILQNKNQDDILLNLKIDQCRFKLEVTIITYISALLRKEFNVKSMVSKIFSKITRSSYGGPNK